ncbi:LacI family DNA-binding transcriptional regulator [Erythrobacter sp. HL-111]|uniref:LacI family DNA-binding transcriptional regulator n=1 Tax=Erythrobacter sp. HL-111 TaxID=1798193 RepID=UPI0006DA9583|nr:LacI family DNA-binding transcriptional regulator [Erythrobacter sp. HL-111]KPP83855.1 MAG: LacI family transcriptional regulator GalR [Erythrobacteraceae bacterium HL-111]SDS79825.1 transcriptional regulator, LacI family [Erythrobacter sp. HL-111]
MGRGNITIEDVAREAGVSRQTVSRVINRSPNVSCSARVRVEQAIEALGYVPNAAARRMGGARSYLLLAAIERAAGDAPARRLQLGQMLLAGLETCSAQGYHLMFEQVADERELGAALTSLTPDGVVLLPPLDESLALHEALGRRGIAVSCLGERVEYGRVLPGLDEAGFGEAAARRMLEQGHRQIGFICGDGACSQRRIEGYRRALAEAGSRAHRRFVSDDPRDFAGAMELARSWLTPTIRPTAIIAGSEAVALGVLQVARELGHAVPRDLSLLALEDTPGLARSQPPVSVLHQPLGALFAAACERLIEAGGGPRGEGAAPSVGPVEAHVFTDRGSIARAPRAV